MRAKVAIQFRDATGTHVVGSEVTFPEEVVARLVEVGILEPGEPEEDETLPESAPEPVEEVKEKTPPKRRRSTRPKGS